MASEREAPNRTSVPEASACPETAHKKLYDEYLQTMIEYKFLWEKEIERCQRQGLPVPEPVPHPSHIVIDMSTGRAVINGPFTPEEKIVWDNARARKLEAQKEIKNIHRMLRNPKNADIEEVLRQDLAHEHKLIQIIGQFVKD